MAYSLNAVTIRTDNTQDGMKKIDELWQDITSGKLPLLFDSERNFLRGVSPVSKYSNYESNETGAYDLTVIGVTAEFFKHMNSLVEQGIYRLYDESDENGDISACTKKAWENVWTDSKSGVINRAFTVDYESTVPAEYTKDGKAHCYLYIALKSH